MALCLWRPHISNALEYVWKRGIPVKLVHEGRPREAGPLLCAIIATDRDNTVLATEEVLAPGELDGRDCRLYFKLPLAPEEEGDESPEDEVKKSDAASLATQARHGFYCRSYILSTRRGQSRALSEILIKTPFRSLWRELRRHERLRVGPGMLGNFRFWFAAALPVNRQQIRHCLSDASQAQSTARLIDVSAGGAFVQLVNYDLNLDLGVDAGTLCLVYLSCLDLNGASRRFFLAGRCVAVFRNRKQSAMNLHLRFTRQLYGLRKEDSELRWLELDDNGVQDLGLWVDAHLRNLTGEDGDPFDFKLLPGNAPLSSG